MIFVKSANLAMRFVLELCALGALGFWGFHSDRGILIEWGLGIGAPLLAAVVWGTFVAPRALKPLSGTARLGVELAVFGSAVAALVLADRPTWGAALALAYVINRVLIVVWSQSLREEPGLEVH